MATIRHETDGSKNLHNVHVVVTKNNVLNANILVRFKNNDHIIKYNDLTKI